MLVIALRSPLRVRLLKVGLGVMQASFLRRKRDLRCEPLHRRVHFENSTRARSVPPQFDAIGSDDWGRRNALFVDEFI